MHTKSHYNLTKKFMKNIDPKIITKVNHALDNASQRDKILAKTYSHQSPSGYYNPYDVFQLGKGSSHRRINHDVLSAIRTGWLIGGQQGVQAAMVHLWADKQRNNLIKQYGNAQAADLFEAVFNYQVSKNG